MEKKKRKTKETGAKYVLQKVQPALLGLMDGSVSTLVPKFAAAGLTGTPIKAFYVGLAAWGISMGLAEALSYDGKVTGREIESFEAPLRPSRQQSVARFMPFHF